MPTATNLSRFLFFLFLLSTEFLIAREVIRVENNLEVTSVNPHSTVYQISANLSGKGAYQKTEEGTMMITREKVSPGFSTDFFWIKFEIENPNNIRLLLELDNPHIDKVELYQIYGEEVVLLNQVGDTYDFYTRPVLNRKFIFELDAPDYSAYLLKIDKRHAAVSFPLKLWSEKHFHNEEKKSDLFFGVYFGILLFISLATLLVGIGLPDRLFLSYSAYVFLVSLYIFTQLGFSFQFIYPGIPIFNSYSRVVLALLVSASAIEFFGRLLSIKQYLPKLDRLHGVIILCLFALLIAWLVIKLVDDEYYRFTIPLLNTLYITIIGFTCSIIYTLVKTWRQQPKNALRFALAFSAITLGSFLYIAVEYGLLPETLFSLNPILMGSIIEILILSFSMAYRIKEINDNKNQLSTKIAIQQKELMRAFVKGEENERTRLSAELHDNVGSNLSLLKRKIETGRSASGELKEDIDHLCDDVRNLSHKLIPHTMGVIGLAKTVQSYCDKFQKDTGIMVNLDIYSFPEIKGDLSMHMFRIIQEALHNIEKHAQTEEVDIQMIGYDDEVVITIDDNGAGFDTSSTNDGVGLQTMKSRVEAFDGTLDISSYPGKGTNILVQFPYSKANPKIKLTE